MKKFLASVLSLAMIVTLSAGCGNEISVSVSGSNQSPASVSTSASDKKDTSAASTETTTSSENVEKANELDEAEVAMIRDFLADNAKVLIEDTENEKNSAYTLEELINHYMFDYAYFSPGFLPSSLEYMIVDMGADLKPELFLHVYYSELSTMQIPMEKFFVIKPVNGELRVTASFDSYYRSYTRMNQYGFVEDGGSNTASNSVLSQGYIDKDGKYQCVAKAEIVYGLSEAKMPAEFLVVQDQSEDIMTGDYSGAGNISCEGWLIGDLSPADYPTDGVDTDWDAYWEKLDKARKYVFYKPDQNGTASVLPEADLLGKITSAGYSVVDGGTIDSLIDEAFKASGLNKEMRNIDLNEQWITHEAIGAKISYANEVSDALREFVYKDGTAELSATRLDLDPGTYKLATLAEELSNFISNFSMADNWEDANFAFIDAGCDGIPEVCIKLKYSDWEGDYEPEYVYAYAYYKDGKVYITDPLIHSESDFYSINRYGIEYFFGYEGAGSTWTEYNMLDSECVKSSIYTINHVMYLGEPTLPEDVLSTSLYKATHSDAEFKWGGDYSVKVYDFEDRQDYDYGEDWDGYYSGLCKKRYYMLFKDNSNIGPDYDYEELCKKNGLNIVSGDFIQDLITKRFEEKGLDRDVVTDPEADVIWQVIPLG